MTDSSDIPSQSGGLNRDMLLNGTVQKQARMRDGSNSTILTTAQLQDSRRQFITDDYAGDDIWVFGYGSLIWNPLIDFEERRDGTAFGYHKRFCLKTQIGRGTPECPGLVLALDYGGSVKGQLFRISALKAARELDVLWKREMLNASYIPKWISCVSDGQRIKALGFVIRHDSPAFTERMTDDEVADIISQATGFLGPCSDYLFETEKALLAQGIKDPYLKRLSELVRLRQEHKK